MFHVLRVIWDVEYDGETLIFTSDPILAKKKSCFEALNFLLRQAFLVQLSAGFKNVICFDEWQKEMLKIGFPKVLSPFHGFEPFYGQKLRYMR